jgi:hypothetical protein
VWANAPRVQDGCSACVAFALVAAAESAAAAALRTHNALAFSEQDLFSCHSPAGRCKSGWNLPQGVGVLEAHGVRPAQCVPYRPDESPPRCQPASPGCGSAPPGVFRRAALRSVAEMQRHMVAHGSVASVMTIHQDFWAHWYGRAAAPYVHDGRSPAIGAHAVQVVGYDSEAMFWVVKSRCAGLDGGGTGARGGGHWCTPAPPAPCTARPPRWPPAPASPRWP